jgi:hypothetical protein
MKRMKSIKVWGIALVAVFAFSAVAVANASASQFEASKEGTLTGHALNNQVFTTGGGGEVTCTIAKTSGTVTELVATHQKVKVEYEGCKAFGVTVKVSPAEYDLFANGEVDILNTITINATVCKVIVNGTENQNLTSVGYANNAGKIIEESTVTGITSKVEGFGCGSASNKGTYTGNNEVELEGGTLKFV